MSKMQKNRGHVRKKMSAKPLSLWLYGRHAVLAALCNPRRRVSRLLLTEKNQATLPSEVRERLHNTKVELVDNQKISELLPEAAVHQGWACHVDALQELGLSFCKDKQRVLLLDQVTDPHNIGAIMRSAAAFDVDALIMTERHAPGETGIVAKVACGALEQVPVIYVTNVAQSLDMLKKQGFWVLGLDGKADTALHEAPQYDKTVFILGAEGKGMRQRTQESCDVLVSLPMSKKMESLNVSNAAAVALYQLYVQKLSG